jgi:hypothetical protein
LSKAPAQPVKAVRSKSARKSWHSEKYDEECYIRVSTVLSSCRNSTCFLNPR